MGDGAPLTIVILHCILSPHLSCDIVIIDRVFNSQSSKKEDQQNCTLDVWRADFGLFRTLINIVPWEAVLRGKAVQEGWSFLNREILKVEKQLSPYAKDEPVGKTSLAE